MKNRRGPRLINVKTMRSRAGRLECLIRSMTCMTCALNAHSGRLMRQSCWLVGRGRSNQHNHAPAPLHGLVVAREREAKETGKVCVMVTGTGLQCSCRCCWYTVDCNLQRPTRLDSARVGWRRCCFAQLTRRQKETVSADRNVGPPCTSITSATLHVPWSISPTGGGGLSLDHATLKSCSGPESRVYEHQLGERSMCRNPQISVARLVPQQISLLIFRHGGRW